MKSVGTLAEHACIVARSASAAKQNRVAIAPGRAGGAAADSPGVTPLYRAERRLPPDSYSVSPDLMGEK